MKDKVRALEFVSLLRRQGRLQLWGLKISHIRNQARHQKEFDQTTQSVEPLRKDLNL